MVVLLRLAYGLVAQLRACQTVKHIQDQEHRLHFTRERLAKHVEVFVLVCPRPRMPKQGFRAVRRLRGRGSGQ